MSATPWPSSSPSRRTRPTTRSIWSTCDYEPLPAVVDPQKAAQERRAGAAREIAPDNIAFHWTVAGGDIDAAFANAEVVVQAIGSSSSG